MRPNPKFEYRNTKQTQTTEPRKKFRKLENSDFEFVSDSGIRASNITKDHLDIGVRKQVG